MKESMTDKEFKELLTQRMKEKGIPVYDLRDVIQGGMMYGTTVDRTFEERSLEGWLEAKKYNDEERAALGRRASWEDLYF